MLESALRFFKRTKEEWLTPTPEDHLKRRGQWHKIGSSRRAWLIANECSGEINDER